MPKAKVNGININYKVEGQGEPLVMIMGFASSRWNWRSQTRAFKKYYRVITFDNRGVGKSDKPGGPYTIKMMAEDTISLMDYLAIDRAYILGISMGGMIAQELAINYPDRVKKLVLGCTFANNKTARGELTNFSPELLEVIESAGQSGTDIRKVMNSLAVCRFNNNNRLRKMTLSFIVRIRILLAGTRGFMGQYEAIRTHDTLDRLHLIKTPTMVITGTADRVIQPGSSEVIAGRIPDARLVKVENGSHSFFFENRDGLNQEVLDFLRSS